MRLSGIMSHSIKLGSGSCILPSMDSIIKFVALLSFPLVTPEQVFSVYGSDVVVMLKR